MKASVRLLLLAAMPLSVLCTVLLVATHDSGHQRSVLRHWYRESNRSQHLESASADLLRSTEAVHAILLALSEGRLTLPEAAERIRSEREGRLPPFCLSPSPQPGESVEEYYLRLTVQMVEWRLQGAARQQDVAQRLQQELQTCLTGSSGYPAREMEAGEDVTE